MTPPGRAFPTEVTFPDGYGRAWDATVAVLASRGFPLRSVARASGIVQTGWRVTAGRYETRVGGVLYYGRKVERLTVLVRPLSQGTAVSVQAQAALVSPEWSAAGTPAPGQAADVPDDTITDYGILHDLARVLRRPLARAPDAGYPGPLAGGGVFTAPVRAAAPVKAAPPPQAPTSPPPPPPATAGGTP